jgi:hypothetical protein
VIPASDRAPIAVVMKILYKMSEHEEFDRAFTECGLLKPLTDLAFGQNEEVSTNAAAILRHVAAFEANAECLISSGILKRLCLALRTDIRRDRFTSDHSLWVYQIVGLFSVLYDHVKDYEVICRYSLPRALLDLTTIYSTDFGLQNAIAKAMTLMMMREDCVDVIEDADLTPFFILLTSKIPRVVNYAALALANAMNISVLIGDAVGLMAAPFGVFGICDILKGATNIDIKVSLMRCLAKISDSKPGIDAIQLHLHIIVPLLDTPMDELETWSPDQILVANTLIVIKNLAIVDNLKASQVMRGKMNQLMIYAVIDYVIDLMRILMKSPEGLEVCQEVKDIEEIRLILGNF